MRPYPFLLLGALAVPLFLRCQGSAVTDVDVSSAVPIVPVTTSLERLVDSLHLDATTIRFHVDKSERRFEVIVNDTVLKSYRCVLGLKPDGDKFHQGDRKTPEGSFTFRSKRVHEQWHKFIWVDYPNTESWRRFNERKAQGDIPAGKNIGGEIGIHGVPDGMDHWIDAGEDWTFGCIALKNTDVDEIYPFIVPERTTIVIEP